MEKIHVASWKAFFAGKRFMKRQAGQGMTEYGLIIALVAVALIIVLGKLSGGLEKTFEKIVANLVQ